MEHDARDRRIAAARAGFTGDLATTDAALNDPDHKVRAAALRSSDRLENLTAHTLSSALQDPHPFVRMAALELAAPRSTPPVGALLDDSDARVIEQAAWACGERPHDPAVTSQLAGLAQTHDDPLVREAAVAALGAIGHEDGLPAILTAASDKPAVRRRAVLSLAAFEGPEVDAAWERARNDRDRQVRDAVDELLGPATTDDPAHPDRS
ncbi:MAG: HEAT repeat domain-containing protein [Acidimicrobiales bacterium]|nr:HEAT repeat domain-containing protein [Acidimicrobiales bacterium]MDG2216437.1 HEAT repeat domain-containing protein [Acidimicrobiales bacterium]